MLFQIVNSLLEREFKEFINKVMAEREKYVVFKKNFKVDILPEFVDIFMKTKHISCMKELALNHI